MAAHIAEGAGAEVEPLPPFTRMVVALDEGSFRGDAEPEVPVQIRGNLVFLRGLGLRVAPRFAAPRVDFFHLANRAIVDQLHHELVLAGRVNLNAHLRDELLLGRELGEPSRFKDRLRQRLLAVHVQPTLHGGHPDRTVHVVRRRHVHRVQILLLVQQHAVVFVHFAVGEAFEDAEAILVHFGDGHELEILAVGERTDVGTGHAVRAETGVEDSFARGRVSVLPPDEWRGTRGEHGSNRGPAGEVLHRCVLSSEIPRDYSRRGRGASRSSLLFHTGLTRFSASRYSPAVLLPTKDGWRCCSI